MNRFIGQWQLISWEYTIDDRHIAESPMGKECAGMLIYTQSGLVAASLMQKNRPLFKSSSLRKGSTAEKINALNGYVSYMGFYSLSENIISHQIKFSLFPNWIGSTLKRHFTFSDKEQILVLETLPIRSSKNETIINTLKWKKVLHNKRF